jgi:hypothetical protein
MNDLDLPPRRTLPPEVRERIRTKVTVARPRSRYRAPLTVAASVVVVIAGIVALHPAAGVKRPHTARPAASLTVTAPDRQTASDLGACGYVAATGVRYRDFPRWVPAPVFTATRGDDVRIVAFRADDGKAGFCEVRTNRVIVSDPIAAPMPIASTSDGHVRVEGLYVTQSGLLAGTATGVAALESWVVTRDLTMRSSPPPILVDGLFVMDVGTLAVGDHVEVQARNSAGAALVSGFLTYDPATNRPVGATGNPR